MRMINLSGKNGTGIKAIVSDVDYKYLSQFRWHMRKDGYVMRSKWIDGKKVKIRMSRVVTGAAGGFVVDHINGNPLDNRRENLRVCSQGENARNRTAFKHNKSGYKGVCLDSYGRTWRAQLCVSGVRYAKSGFKTSKDAAMYYDSLAKKYHKSFAKLNFN